MPRNILKYQPRIQRDTIGKHPMKMDSADVGLVGSMSCGLIGQNLFITEQPNKT
jgi:hypothetical protein